MHRSLSLMFVALLPLMAGCMQANAAPDVASAGPPEGPRIVTLSGSAISKLNLQGSACFQSGGLILRLANYNPDRKPFNAGTVSAWWLPLPSFATVT